MRRMVTLKRYAADVTPEAMRDVRALAEHHARFRNHPVVIRLAQEVHIVPDGEPAASAAMAVTARTVTSG